MIESIVFCIITVSIIAAIFFAWLFYQKARDKERMYLIEKGEKFADVFKAQKEHGIKFIFPWLQLAIVTSSLSIAFVIIAFLIQYLDNDEELFKGFLITAIIGFFLSISLFILNAIFKKKR
ncbi:hypothetical protein MTsPCn9_25360 [Croceitalea sp. MTPC9]|uniref:hypothetical protein n=1 Tax=unclassified Croceitalea TaxID=2632280 RepID=UPI002B3DA69F|nr:hypothetical protein MTsPCn6_29170 [Croceitalea sp. MTPC6]GMN17598.1 hypothetical protein MTsPCn9_25360 [Croceitalea sp. MTPC9]